MLLTIILDEFTKINELICCFLRQISDNFTLKQYKIYIQKWETDTYFVEMSQIQR